MLTYVISLNSYTISQKNIKNILNLVMNIMLGFGNALHKWSKCETGKCL